MFLKNNEELNKLIITSRQSRIRTIKSDDEKFMLKDGYMIAPRAGFEIDSSCPREYKLIIAKCIDNGWLKPIANVKDHELFWKEFEQ